MAAANFRHLGVPYRTAWKTVPKVAKNDATTGQRSGGTISDSPNSTDAFAQEDCASAVVMSKSQKLLTEIEFNQENCDNILSQRSEAIQLSIGDAQSINADVDCLVTNLPYNRFLEVSASEIEKLVRSLRSCAHEFVFFAGAPLHSTLKQAGYEVIVEIDIGNRGKRFMSWARSSERKACM